MTRAALFSALLHIGVALLVVVGVPTLFAPDVTLSQPIPVTIYTVAEETRMPEPEPVDEAPAEPVPEPELPPEFVEPTVVEAIEPTPAPELPPPPEPTPVEPVEAAPPPPEPEPEPEIVTLPEPKPEPKPEPPPAAEPPPAVIPPPDKPETVAEAPPAPVPKPKPTPPLQFASLLNSLEEHAREAATEEPVEPRQDAALPTVPSSLATAGAVTLSEIDAIRRQIEDNWNVPAGARDAEDLQVGIRISVLPDGTVREAVILDSARMASDEFFRAAAESARRAIFLSSPLRDLPPEKYDSWREITLNFDPREVVSP